MKTRNPNERATIGSECLPLESVLAALDDECRRPSAARPRTDLAGLKIAVVRLTGRPPKLEPPPRKPARRRRKRRRRRSERWAKPVKFRGSMKNYG